MQTLDDIIDKLNSLLQHSGQGDEVEASFSALLIKAKERFSLKLKFVDFAYYTTKLMNSVKAEKIKNIESQNFKKAAENRDLEKLCLDYAELKRKFKITKSYFYHEGGYLFYFHLGTARSDNTISEAFKKALISNKND